MTEENQKDLFSSQIKINNNALIVPKHDVLVIIVNNSDQCFHSIG